MAAFAFRLDHRVTMAKGTKMKLNSGQSSAFSKPMTATAHNAVPKLSIVTRLSRKAIVIKAAVWITQITKIRTTELRVRGRSVGSTTSRSKLGKNYGADDFTHVDKAIL